MEQMQFDRTSSRGLYRAKTMSFSQKVWSRRVSFSNGFRCRHPAGTPDGPASHRRESPPRVSPRGARGFALCGRTTPVPHRHITPRAATSARATSAAPHPDRREVIVAPLIPLDGERVSQTDALSRDQPIGTPGLRGGDCKPELGSGTLPRRRAAPTATDTAAAVASSPPPSLPTLSSARRRRRRWAIDAT